MKKRIPILSILVLLAGLLRAGENAKTPPPAPAVEDYKPMRILAAAHDPTGPCFAQLLGDLDRPVGEAIKLHGLTMPAKVDDKGHLELDVKGDGKTRTISQSEVIPVTLKGEGDKPKTLNIKLQVFKNGDGVWVYRNLTQLAVQIENETFVIIDARGNGVYNESGVAGMAWQGESYYFPLPAESERWCSATHDFTGLKLGLWGENAAVQGRPLATTVAGALPVLKGVNDERVKLGLTPRPEDVKLSADLQKHCAYMSANGQLTHPEDKNKPGYSAEGNAAGLRSILGEGTPAPGLALGMVLTYFHRIDVIRPNTAAFGVGYEGKFGGIDGRTNCSSAPAGIWPVLCPAPWQRNLGTTFRHESPNPIPGGGKEAGLPITAYFGTNKLKLVSYTLKAAGPAANMPVVPPLKVAPVSGENVDCYLYDPQTGESSGMTSFECCVCVIPKEPLKPNTEYEVTFNIEESGKPLAKTWCFATGGGRPGRPGQK